MTPRPQQDRLNPIQRMVMALAVLTGASSERIDQAIIEQRETERRERQQLLKAQLRFEANLKRAQARRNAKREAVGQ